MTALEFAGPAVPLTPRAIAKTAAWLGVDVATVRAVCEVESGGGGFLPDNRPKILFEAHLFGRLTSHRWDGRYPNISAPQWDRSLYGAGGAHQYSRLGAAIALDRAAALQSASFGLFQILGLNHAAAGYAEVEPFVTAMTQGEPQQLDAFAAFVRANRLDDDLRRHDWSGFARGYNGPGQVAHYAAALSGAWNKWSTYPVPVAPAISVASNPVEWHGAALDPTHTLQPGALGPRVLALQRRLAELGYTVAQDGQYGKQTSGTVAAFQRPRGLTIDRIAGPETLRALIA